jgi:hypothetical protein
MHDRRRLRRMILALSGMVCSCVLVALLSILLRPPQFTTRIEAISYALSRQGAEFEEVLIERGWPDQINSSTYTTSLRIRTRTLGEVGGRYECRNGETSCWVAVPKLNIDMVPVPDLRKSVEVPLLTWLEQRYNAIIKH